VRRPAHKANPRRVLHFLLGERFMPTIRYYEDTERHWADLSEQDFPVLYAPLMAERILGLLGLEGRLQYHVHPTGDWHRFDTEEMVAEFSGPLCSVLDVLHELAHWWEPRHDPHHAMAMQLLACAYEAL